MRYVHIVDWSIGGYEKKSRKLFLSEDLAREFHDKLREAEKILTDGNEMRLALTITINQMEVYE